MYIIMALIALAVVVSPIVCITLFIYSLSELIKNKSEIKKHPERNYSEDNEKQIIRMIVTGVIGAITGAVDIFIIITVIKINTGEISIM